MNFTVSCSALLSRLQSVGRVISSKSPMAILDNFLLKVENNVLTVTASDLETTMTATLELESSDGDIVIALPAKLLMETLKEFSEQPLTFEVNTENFAVLFRTETGTYNFIGQNGMEFPKAQELADDAKSITMPAELLAGGVSKTSFATATDDLRPTMTGIFFNFMPDAVTFVATDAHKLVRLKNTSVHSEEEMSFILPKKPATLLKNILGGEKGDVNVSFDNKNIVFDMPSYRMICRQIEGRYPSYNNVIPQNNPYRLIVDRLVFINALKRVMAFANQGTMLVKLAISAGSIQLSAQDIDFSISAEERIACQYEGDAIHIGFKAPLLIDILNGISSADIIMELADPSRAGIILPFENEQDEDLLMLLMPMLIND